MLMKLSLAAGLLVAAAAFAPHTASAAPQSKLPGVADNSLLQTVHFRKHCRHWRHECADRFGWRSRGYFRCVARHGC